MVKKQTLVKYLFISLLIIIQIIVVLIFTNVISSCSKTDEPESLPPVGNFNIDTSFQQTIIHNGENKEITSSKIKVDGEETNTNFLSFLSCEVSDNEYYSSILSITNLFLDEKEKTISLSIAINNSNTVYGMFKFHIYFQMKNSEATTNSSTIVELNIQKDNSETYWNQDDLFFINYATVKNPITICMGPTQDGETPWEQEDLAINSGLQDIWVRKCWNQLLDTDTFADTDVFLRLTKYFNFCIRFSITGDVDISNNRFSCENLLVDKAPNFLEEKADRNYKLIHFGKGPSVGGYNVGTDVCLQTPEESSLEFWTQHEFIGHTVLNLEDEYGMGDANGNILEEPQSQVDLIELRHMNFSNFGIDYVLTDTTAQWCEKSKPDILWKKLIDAGIFGDNIDDYCPNGNIDSEPVQWWIQGAHTSSPASKMRGFGGNFTAQFLFTLYLKCHVKDEDRESEWFSGDHFDLSNSTQEQKDELWDKYLSWNDYVQQKMDDFIAWY